MANKKEIFDNKRPDRTYYSPSFKNTDMNGSVKNVRYVDKAIDVSELHEFFKEKDSCESYFRETRPRGSCRKGANP